MYLAILISEVRKELKAVGSFVNGDLEVLKFSNDVCVLRLETEAEYYIVKYYLKDNVKEKVKILNKLEKYGIEVGVVSFSNKIIIFKDYERNGFYRNITINDCKDEMVVKNLAILYKKFHSINNLKIINKKDYFTLANVRRIYEFLSIEGKELMEYIYTNFNNIKLKLDRLETSLLQASFSLDNLMISKDNTNVIIKDFDNLIEGFRWENIREIVSFFDGSISDIFYMEYGKISEEEKIACDLVSCVYNLVLLKDKELSLLNYNDILKDFNDKKLFEEVKAFVEWH